MKTIQAYRFALDLTPTQERSVLAHAGAARVAHNWALAWYITAYPEDLTPERRFAVGETNRALALLRAEIVEARDVP